ncbi:Adenosine/AMP deaminase domain [Macleaya cordata]|uniref:AMP deaminase n=1 Tax=Macleaya cordata TaxID=56857 RepID=A0A200PWY7_MACCD|nr:Adenosine/AMP deaminase domain [Macleaya cordata]
METYALHLAMAALVGASFVAVSAYYMHRRTLTQLLEFAKTVERERDRENGVDDENEAEKDDSPQHFKKYVDKRRSHGRRKGNGYYRRVSNSLPDVTTIATAGEVEEKQNGSLSIDDRLIPAGLPRLRKLPEGQPVGRGSSTMRAGNIVRPASPKSPVASASAFESVEGSDDEDLTDNAKLDTSYLLANGDAGTDSKSLFQNMPDHINAIVEQNPIAAASMIRSHSVSGDLHGVQPDPVAADILRKEPEQETFVRLKITPTEVPSPDEVEVYQVLQQCLELRERYLFREEVAPWEKEVITDPSTPKPDPNPFSYSPEAKSDHYFRMEDGVVHVYANKDSTEKLFPVADATTFFTDLHRVLRIIAAGNIRTLCYHRLVLLEQKFNLHLMLNADREFLAQKSAPHRDFYNVRKVDTHVHHSACMNQKHLLRFIKSKLRKEPDEVVIFRDGTYLTLKEVFESLDLTGYDLNVDLLDVHADKSTFHRFDKFNLKYNPCGQSRLREIFLKQDNLIQGRFLGELTKQVFSDLSASKYQMAEYRISIYGRKQSEWDQLASWIVNNDLYSENVVWLIQLPRLYNVYKEMGIVTSFQNMLDNIFLPLFEVTVDPDSHPQLHVFLKQVVGLDLVDDESKPERRPTKHMPTPDQWTNIFNPAFSYYVYYCYANLYTLNKLRESKGMTTIKFRPHAGEAGDIDHLAATFLTCHNIAHGINLRKSPVLQYLYYLAQIGLAMSPLSNNSLFLDYHRNPFPMFFLRGLNVSLSTDDPLQIHLTKEPLVEEYSIAASVWKLSSCDLCEIARNSVYQSGFSHALKSHWIGKSYYKRGPDGNDIHKTNVPHIRVEFRDTIWREEMQQVYLGKAKIPEEVDK